MVIRPHITGESYQSKLCLNRYFDLHRVPEGFIKPYSKVVIRRGVAPFVVMSTPKGL